MAIDAHLIMSYTIASIMIDERAKCECPSDISFIQFAIEENPKRIKTFDGRYRSNHIDINIYAPTSAVWLLLAHLQLLRRDDKQSGIRLIL